MDQPGSQKAAAGGLVVTLDMRNSVMLLDNAAATCTEVGPPKSHVLMVSAQGAINVVDSKKMPLSLPRDDYSIKVDAYPCCHADLPRAAQPKEESPGLSASLIWLSEAQAEPAVTACLGRQPDHGPSPKRGRLSGERGWCQARAGGAGSTAGSAADARSVAG